MEETGAAKVVETEAVVRWQRKQRECLHSRYIGGKQWKHRGSSGGVVEGTGAVVSTAGTVAMALADNSGNGGAGNDRGNRGSGGATTINQNAAAAEAKMVVVAVAGGSENRAGGGGRGGRGSGSGGGRGGGGWWGEARGERW